MSTGRAARALNAMKTRKHPGSQAEPTGRVSGLNGFLGGCRDVGPTLRAGSCPHVGRRRAHAASLASVAYGPLPLALPAQRTCVPGAWAPVARREAPPAALGPWPPQRETGRRWHRWGEPGSPALSSPKPGSLPEAGDLWGRPHGAAMGVQAGGSRSTEGQFALEAGLFHRREGSLSPNTRREERAQGRGRSVRGGAGTGPRALSAGRRGVGKEQQAGLDTDLE